MPLYAAYGSNLDPEIMAKRAPHSPLWSTGWLAGWRLTFGGGGSEWGGALTTLVEDSGSSVFVALYDVPACDEPLLDSWEGTDNGVYSRIRVRVRTLLDGDATAWVYVLNDYEGGLPSALSLGAIADAAEKAGAPAAYVAELRGRPCASVDL
ncbi:gamma-glutamylcyclotransferase family protein [Marinitenerispora sediminis]|uniref:Gamma-glutamylcyclotransferase n=1 Tax=Marinitenerispora sediminis TaxID=1931232 RepID=A0A368T3V5_9ACTN|nr:gamma-glutamylcyclotransferase family protein [Marinitenerispora sediminis]RCV49671.1 gamma-glutamylcyclotransferase [Marinitenerispora sediminis]RCV53198.1 gamma-glutamylcyclotransferase [Marinitenerispora sediminis]RCV57322.1 gamma-glutamylcyclotransferase [Marinitenerispora sediminis]